MILRRRPAVRWLGLGILGWTALSLLSRTGFNPDPTDPANVAPITLVNDTTTAVRVLWCGGDGADACAEQDDLGVIPAGTTRQVRISSYEVLLRVRTAAGPGRYVCEDGAPGSRLALGSSYLSTASAYDHCLDGDPAP